MNLGTYIPGEGGAFLSNTQTLCSVNGEKGNYETIYRSGSGIVTYTFDTPYTGLIDVRGDFIVSCAAGYLPHCCP